MGLMSTVQTLRNGNASMPNEDIYNGDECNYSRQANEKGGTWQLELLLCNASYDEWLCTKASIEYDTGQSQVCITHSLHELTQARGMFCLFHFMYNSKDLVFKTIAVNATT